MRVCAVSPWDQRIDRALTLADEDATARPLLHAYAALLRLQRSCSQALRESTAPVSGDLDRDLPILRDTVPAVLRTMASTGPADVARDAAEILAAGEPAIDAMLRSGWRAAAGRPLLARLVLQPYAEWLAALGIAPAERAEAFAAARCPFCGGAPQLSILRSRGEGDGGGRELLCATCATTWECGRILCVFCGEQDERRLVYYRSPRFDHLRVDACDSCRRYVKTVDLTRFGHAVPLADEIAGAALDLWARDHGYDKIEPNLVGL